MIRKSYAPKGATTARQRKTQGGSWLLVNTTPDASVDSKMKLGRQLTANPQGSPAKVAMDKSALSRLGKWGLGLAAGGVLGSAGIRGYLDRPGTDGEPATSDESLRLQKAIGAQDIPDFTISGPSVDPRSVAYFVPEIKADREVMESWLPYVPHMAAKARQHGAVISGGRPQLGLLAHEFGHGTGLGAKPLWRNTIQRLAARGPNTGSIVSAIAGALAGQLGTLRGGLAGGLLGAGAQLPTLIEETRANLRARKALKAMGVTDPAVYNKLRNVQIAQTVPMLGGAMTGAGTAMLMRALRKAGSFELDAQPIDEKAEQIMAPTTWGGLAGEAAVIPAAKTLWHGAKTVGKQFAPRAALKSVGSWLGSPVALSISTGTELANTLIGAKMNPDYQAGNISYGQSVRQQLSASGEAAQLKAQQAFKGKLGTVKGLLSSPLQGIMSPVSTLAGFVQALKHSGKRLVGMDDKKADILAPYIKRAIEEAGGSGGTLQDMVGGTPQPPAFLTRQQPKVPAFLGGGSRVPALKQRIVSWLLGIKPAELSGVSSALSGVGRASNALQGLVSSPKE
jgi:hypothetical protein